MTSDADKAAKAKNVALSKSLRAKAHMLWLQERQALDEVSKDRQMVKQEEAAEAHAESEAATLAARMDKRIAAVNAEVCTGLCRILQGFWLLFFSAASSDLTFCQLNDAKQEALKAQQESKQASRLLALYFSRSTHALCRQANAIKPSLLAVKKALLQVTRVVLHRSEAAVAAFPFCGVACLHARFYLPALFSCFQTEANAKKAEMQK